jgi:hypothetical protein
MFRDVMVVLFAVTTGFTASGIVSNAYQLIAGERKDGSARRTVYYAVMVIAGPSVLFENAAKARRTKSCSRLAFWLAAAVAGYWSFALGLFVLDFALAI